MNDLFTVLVAVILIAGYLGGGWWIVRQGERWWRRYRIFGKKVKRNAKSLYEKQAHLFKTER